MKWLATVGVLVGASVAWGYQGPGGRHCGSKCCDTLELILAGMSKPDEARTSMEDDLVSFFTMRNCPAAAFGDARWSDCRATYEAFYARECPPVAPIPSK